MNIKWLARIIASVSLLAAGIVTSSTPALASPILNSPAPQTFQPNELVDFQWIFPYGAVNNEFSVKLTNRSDTSITRTIVITTNIMIMGGSTILDSFDPLAPPSEIAAAMPDWNVSVRTNNGSLQDYVRMPFGSYDIDFSYIEDVTSQPNSTRNENITFSSSRLLCPAGTYASDGLAPLSGVCTPAPVGSYVALAGSSIPIACPGGTNTISTGSAAVSDCGAPVVSTTPTAVKSSPTLGKGKKLKIKTLATQIGMSVPAKAKASAKISKASKKICKVSGSSIKGLKPGACVLTVKVKPKNGKATTQSATITVI